MHSLGKRLAFRLRLRTVWQLCCLLALMGASDAMAALFAEYRFEETSYTGAVGEVADTSGNGRHGRMVGAVSASTIGRTCRGILIGDNSTSTIAAFDTGIDVNAIGNAGSIAFWYRGIAGSTSRRVLFDATTSTSGDFYAVRNQGTTKIDLEFSADDGGGSLRSASVNDVVTEDTWTHIVFTWLATSTGRMRIYVDGVLRRDQARSFSGSTLTSAIDTLYFGDNRSGVSAYLRSAYGYIDQIRIYNHELTLSEVNADFSAAPACATLDHLRITTASSAVPGTNTTVTVTACANADCSVNYDGGVTGTLTASGTAMAVSFPAGAAFTIPAGASSTAVVINATPEGSVTLGATGVLPYASAPRPVYCGIGIAAASGNSCALPVFYPLHHLELTTAAASGVTCNPVTYTVKACANTACSILHTQGVSGTLSIGGAGISVTYPSGAAFTVAPGGTSTTTVSAHITTTGTATASLGGLSVTPTGPVPVYCGMGAAATSGGSCAITTSTAALLFDVPNHRADAAQTVTVSAVRQSDNSLACTPAFANVSRSVTLRCSYGNPATGTLPVRVGGTALNAAGNAAAACDGGGRAVSLAFNASGVASTTVQYADAGLMTLNATYTGSGADAGLTMNGSDTFTTAPYRFSVTGLPGSNVAAGSSFSGTVTALNFSGNATPNFGREASAQGATLAWARSAPTGAGAAAGSFSGSLGSFSGGSATASNLSWTEVGRGEVSAVLAGGSYLGTGMTLAGNSSGGLVWCANEWGSCPLPSGTTATVYYGQNGLVAAQSGLSGNVGCNNTVFGDPNVGVAKSCWYVVTGGVSSSLPGTVTTRPHNFAVMATPACPAGSFTYAGQAYTVTVTARNAAGGTTINYDGTSSTTPNFAQAVTLTDMPNLGVGTLAGNTIAASGFVGGVGTATPSYSFTSKLTAPQALVLRASNASGVSSAGGVEATMPLRSGRLRLSNAFGRPTATLQVPVTAEYWGGAAWVVNAADGCTTVPAAAVALSNPRSATGAASTASTSAAAVTLSAGRGNLNLAAPTPAGSSLTLDLALNLGSTAADQSCNTSRPATTGAGLPWLRSSFGSCAVTSDRDPSARASFGIFSPENRRIIHSRELF